MAIESYANVWDALLDSPEEAANMKLRSQLIIECGELVKSWGISQKDAAKKLKLTQPRLNDLLRGKLEKFSLDALVTVLWRAGQEIELTVQPRHKTA